jgi:ElaB/YqjD/DUF883 family membrane-anchored ribosome-binding protein
MNEQQVHLNVLTSELEQLVAEAHIRLKAQGVEYCERLSELFVQMKQNEKPWDHIGLLAEIGYIYALTQFADTDTQP